MCLNVSVTLRALVFLHVFALCVCVCVCVVDGWALEDWLRSLFSHAFSVYELLCVSGPYIITNELVIHNAAERKPLCPAELLEL